LVPLVRRAPGQVIDIMDAILFDISFPDSGLYISVGILPIIINLEF
jgi:hypothetical protein